MQCRARGTIAQNTTTLSSTFTYHNTAILASTMVGDGITRDLGVSRRAALFSPETKHTARAPLLVLNVTHLFTAIHVRPSHHSRPSNAHIDTHNHNTAARHLSFTNTTPASAAIHTQCSHAPHDKTIQLTPHNRDIACSHATLPCFYSSAGCVTLSSHQAAP
jgi:hypothetical protein